MQGSLGWQHVAVADAGVRQPGGSTTGVLWAVARVLCLLTVAAFSVATWGLFTRGAWWEAVALGSAAVGLVALVPYWVAAIDGGETVETVIWNAFVHVVMVAGVFSLLVAPPLERWVDHHVMGG